MKRVCLVLEDSQIQARVIAAMFKPLGWDVLTAFNLKSALFTLQSQHVDMCLSDLILPDDPDMTAIRTIKEAQPGIIVAAMTAGGTGTRLRDALIQARTDGAEFLLPKPFSEDRLATVIEEVDYRLNHNRRRSQVMVIDPSSAVRMFCRKALEAAGCRVVEAPTLNQARSIVDVLDLNAIVFDVSVSDMPAIESLPKLREQLPGVGLVSMSGTDDKDGTLRKALLAGADVALAKPFSAPELTASVRKAEILASAQLLEMVRSVA
jgi:DNA-binding NtrC family response regulator